MSQSILVCDDQITSLQLLIDLLESNGYVVYGAATPHEALRLCDDKHPDLLLLDIQLPMMNGFELYRQIKSKPEFAEIPAIFLSAYHTLENRLQSFDLGASDFIPKPFDVREILARVEKHLQLAEKPKELAQQVHDRDMAIFTATHDLRNPIANIDLAASLIRGSFEGRAAFTEQDDFCFEMIEAATRKMNSIIDDVLSFAELQNARGLETTKIEIYPLLHGIFREYQFSAREKDITLSFNFDGSQADQANVHDDYIKRMVGNLISNAIKYTPDKGSVILDVLLEEDELAIAVEDNGYGIPDDMLEEIFKQFVRVNEPEHRAQSGTGLGLSVVQRIVALHKGKIDVKSEVGKGTRFTVFLPTS